MTSETESANEGTIVRGSRGVTSSPVTVFTVWQHRRMAGDRIVVGATEDDAAARTAARALRDEGHEIVFVGGHQTPEHLVRTAVAEDATRIVVDADEKALHDVLALCAALDVADIGVECVV